MRNSELTTAIPEYLVCPRCKHRVEVEGERLRCPGCQRRYHLDSGIWNLLYGEPFRDDPDPDRSASEERMDSHTTTNYILPLLARTRTEMNLDRPLRVLSVGCGVGVDVDLITEAGHECVGIDCGSRVLDWKKRRNKNHLFLASGTYLPFDDAVFDVVFGGCVLPHVGVIGDSWLTTATYQQERLQFCKEITRVTRKGGRIVLTGANRACPFDLFHRDHGYMPRFHPPSEPFLVSYRDYSQLFIEQCGCVRLTSLPITGYWGFNGLYKSLVGRLCARLIDAHMRLVSIRALPFLQRSFLNPWLIVQVER